MDALSDRYYFDLYSGFINKLDYKSHQVYNLYNRSSLIALVEFAPEYS